MCGSTDLSEQRVRAVGPLRRCRRCRLAFLDDRGYEGIDPTLDESGQKALGAARRKLFGAGLRGFERYRRRNSLLDVGCGNGTFAEMAASKGWRVTTVEPSQHLCSLARSRGSFGVVRATAEQLPLPAAAFDVVCLWDVVDLVPNPRAAFEEALRVLRPGGLIHIRVRNGPVHLFMRRAPLIPDSAAVIHEILFSGRSLRSALEMTGFTDCRTASPPLTSGNPYRTEAGFADLLLAAVKLAWDWPARALAFVSRGRWLIGPSIQATATRAEQ